MVDESKPDGRTESVSPPYTVNPKILQRFDERKNVFGRMFHDRSASFFQTSMYKRIPKILAQNKDGYSQVEFARTHGGWAVYDYFTKAFAWQRPRGSRSMMEKPPLERYLVSDRRQMSKEVKHAAAVYGADLAGVAARKDIWVYSHDMTGEEVHIPESFEFAIVMAIHINREGIEKSPGFASCTASAVAYSRMVFCIACMATFIRNLGYDAIPMANDTALSIPMAIDAGLGELGRNGLLITPAYGPAVKICKVFTDLPLAVDKPSSFGVEEFCRTCNRCIEACEAECISKARKPSFEVVCPSNNAGIRRWPVHHDSCYSFWIENGGECNNCISECPYFQKTGSLYKKK